MAAMLLGGRRSSLFFNLQKERGRKSEEYEAASSSYHQNMKYGVASLGAFVMQPSFRSVSK